MRLTKEQLEKMLPGQVLTAKCVGTGEWESAKRIAQRVKSEYKRKDGETYTVSQNVNALTVTIETSNNAGL